MINRNFLSIRLTIRLYVLVIIIFTSFRVLLFLSQTSQLSGTTIGEIFTSFLIGLRFDIVISSYIIFLPYIIFTVLSHVKFKSMIVRTIMFYYFLILFALAFLVCAVDIPYFKQFFSRLTVTAFTWFDSPLLVIKMIFQDFRFWGYIIPLSIAIFIFILALKKIFSEESLFEKTSRPVLHIIVSIVFLSVIFLGIRGRLEEKSPIRVGTAYFCNNPFLNQVGLNPNFTLIRSYLDSRNPNNKYINLMDDSIAVANVQTYLGINKPDSNYPLLRKMTVDSVNIVKHNVVVIIMESMSAAHMKHHGNINNLTAFLDSIADEGYYFENAYTSGIHTFNGIFSTLFSYPALFRQHPMKESSMFKYRGIASTLKSLGYSTIYFTTHDGQFDNAEGFLKDNEFEDVIAKDDYPFSKSKTTLGVPDDYMFEFSIPVLNTLNETGKPFFAAFMTASDHRPFYIPDYFKPNNQEADKAIVEYADYSLKKFLFLSAQQEWYRNTIFVFVADHGAALQCIYDIPLDYLHTPLIFYAPHIITEKKVFSKVAGQIDIFPSIMGLLRLPYLNNTLGVNLFSEERPFIYFNYDDKYGVIDDTWLLIVKTDHSAGLYQYRLNDAANYAITHPDIVLRMKTYAESNLQSFQYILRTQKL